jgi:hypothetical protein
MLAVAVVQVHQEIREGLVAQAVVELVLVILVLMVLTAVQIRAAAVAVAVTTLLSKILAQAVRAL